jgi:hypothetical protein
VSHCGSILYIMIMCSVTFWDICFTASSREFHMKAVGKIYAVFL